MIATIEYLLGNFYKLKFYFSLFEYFIYIELEISKLSTNVNN